MDEYTTPLGHMQDPRKVPVAVGRSGSVAGSSGYLRNLRERLGLVGKVGTMKSEDQAPKQKVKELDLEVVSLASPSSTYCCSTIHP